MLQVLPALAITLAVAATSSNEAPQRTVVVQLIHRCGASTQCLGNRIVGLMKKETERIWSRLEVGMAWIDSTAPPPAEPAGIRVMLEEVTFPEWAGQERVLAALSQPAVVCGWGLVHIWVRHVEQHAALAGRGHTFTSMPPAVTETFLIRALGRVLAHEIGHYLLGTGEHSARGLMRAKFRPKDLLDGVTPSLYGLNARERAGLMSCRTPQLARLATQTHDDHE
jgi:hypothetical protein